jgi:hypothetical protein
MRGHVKELSLLILRNTGHENETSAVFYRSSGLIPSAAVGGKI